MNKYGLEIPQTWKVLFAPDGNNRHERRRLWKERATRLERMVRAEEKKLRQDIRLRVGRDFSNSWMVRQRNARRRAHRISKAKSEAFMAIAKLRAERSADGC